MTTRESGSGSGSAFLRASVVLVITGIGLIIAQWPVFSSGFALFASADRYDGLIAAAIHEHWYAYLSGAVPVWNKVEYFHPWPNTLALNDGYILHGLVHGALRSLGMPPLLASDIAGMALRVVTGPAIYLLARRHIGLSVSASLAAALLAMICANLAIEVIHAQFAAVGPALACALLSIEFLATLRTDRTAAALAYGISAAVLAGALMLTSFYVTYTLVIAVLVGVGFYLTLSFAARQMPVTLTTRYVAIFGIVALGCIVAMVPAAMLYLPQIKAGGLHDIDQARHYAMTPAGLLDPGLRSSLWSWSRLTLSESSVAPHGYGPLLLATALFGTVSAMVQALRRGSTASEMQRVRLVAALGLTWMSLVAISTDWWGFWPWELVWNMVPGAGAYRVTSRICLIMTPVAMLVATWWIFTALRRRLGAFAVALVVGCLVLEQIVPLPRGPDRGHEEARLASLVAPPSRCEVFVATRAREGDTLDRYAALYSHNVDAMMAAAYLRLPTINGISTFVPPGWNLSNPQYFNYPVRVRAEAERQALRPCGLDFATLRWASQDDPFAGVPHRPPSIAFQPGVGLPVSSATAGIDELLMSGWSAPEAQGVWSVGPEAALSLPLSSSVREGTLKLAVWGFSNSADSQYISLRLASGLTKRYRVSTLKADEITIAFASSDIVDGLLVVRIAIEQPEAPNSSTDRRLLGVSLRNLAIM